jgi:hydroxymethylglutaryl-CoA lyase
LGFPLSLSETFQQRNTNRSIADAYTTVANIAALCVAESRQLVVYLSMGFGNPYGDAWNVGIVEAFTARLVELGIGIISLADTVGTAVAADITPLYQTLTTRYPTVEIGAHFHANPTDWESKIAAAYQGGCRRFDGALKGYGGCPYAKDELVGNIATENLIRYFRDQNEPAALQLNDEALAAALALVMPTFAEHHPTT